MRETNWPRRDFLALGAAALVPALARNALAAEAGEMTFTLKETAGLRRFGYPVFTTLPLDPGPLKFRLERNGQPVSAQFRPYDPGAGKTVTALDFIASPGPLESETYVVKYGPDETPGPEPKEGMSVARGNGVWIVRNKGSLAYEVPEHLDGWLRSVVNGGVEYLLSKHGGLSLTATNEATQLVGDLDSQEKGTIPVDTVVRQGPLAIGLRFQGTTRFEGLGAVRSTVDMTFPSSKSWVEVNWTVDDPNGWITTLSAMTALRVEGEPITLDFGADHTVYASLRSKERMGLQAGDASGSSPPKGNWHVTRFGANGKSFFARSTGDTPQPAEGWAHAMDQKRCTAVALEKFGRATLDDIQITGNGRVALNRIYAWPKSPLVKGRKSLRFWLHFVPMPVQIGAVTSPQAMLAPLVIEWVQPKKG